jgi:2-dehydro-3-deoxyphosphogluconate aldolase/(4S)-4-hydroxy-2-oxoglutarate aldolase
LLAGGLQCVEITFRTDAAAGAIRRARAIDGLLVGAGTILLREHAEAAVEAGAQFGLTPGLNEDVVDRCRALGLPFFPGVATPSEIERALALGLRTVKVFPIAQLGGAPESVLACGGTWLARPELLRAGRFDEVQRLAREAVRTHARLTTSCAPGGQWY